MKNLGWTEEQMEIFRRQIWQGSYYPVWEKFINQMKRKIVSEPNRT
jgi:uncharacterized protein (DUF608 family)